MPDLDHAPQPAPAPPKRSRRSKAPADLTRVAEQYAAGLTTRAIAEQYDTSHASVLRWLDKHKQAQRAVDRFKVDRADILARVQSKALQLQETIVDELAQDGLRGALTTQQKAGLLQSLNIVHGTLFDKERLERGQSTANISTISKMLDNQVSTLFKRQVIPHIDQSIRSTPESEEKPNEINSPNV